MGNALKKYFSFIWLCLKPLRKWILIFYSAYTALTGLDLLPAQYKNNQILSLLPNWQWQTWALIGMFIFIVFFIRGARERFEEVNKALIEIRSFKAKKLFRLSEIIKEAERLSLAYQDICKLWPNSTIAKQPLRLTLDDLGMGPPPEQAKGFVLSLRRHIEEAYTFIMMWEGKPQYAELFTLLQWIKYPQILSKEDRLKIDNIDSYIRNGNLPLHVRHLQELYRKIESE
jgi:hypothetical protein